MTKQATAATRLRPLCRTCLDWSEWRDHLAGAPGSMLLARFEDQGWLKRMPHSRWH